MKDRLAEILLSEMKDLRTEYDFLREVYFERNQLYGVLIKFMKDEGWTSLEIEYDALYDSNSHILNFVPNEETRILKFELISNDDYKKEKADE
jgi:hypothetical protein